MNLSLKNRNALVCGSTQGIGLATALQLAKLGANVTLLARNEESLKKSLEQLDNQQGQNHNYICADFSQPNVLEQTLADYLADGRHIHILINNTGGPKGGPIQKAAVDEFRHAFEMHLVCKFLITHSS
ncbi:MAG: SDR family NAD(P)-dependent oxidoreductase [Saprospiraceae bacterium]|nr:SDR family NAD(P)-dependent oxidoreductase [Saprospiraceae bacterium]